MPANGSVEVINISKDLRVRLPKALYASSRLSGSAVVTIELQNGGLLLSPAELKRTAVEGD